MRIGIYGGSFNPVHCGHILVARSAIEELALDRLFFVPAAESPFKPGVQLAPAELRLRWLRLSLAGFTQCEVDCSEIERGGVSYSIDTVREYAGAWPGAELYYLIGGDHVAQLPRWRDASALAQLVTFVVLPRPGGSTAEAAQPFKAMQLRGFPLALSASEVRRRVQSGLPIDHLVADAVAASIRESAIYQTQVDC